MDLNLPGKGGIEILADLRGMQAYQHIPVVVMTSSSAPSDRNAAEQLGISYYFHKPPHLEGFLQLGSIVRGILHAAQ